MMDESVTSIKLNHKNLHYKALLGVGGIGHGDFFLLNQSHTLGREESRSGRFLEQNDYCKLHIISHYVQVMLGNKINVIPIGLVGDDDIGEHLIQMMGGVGMDLKYVNKCRNAKTLYSFCFLYPDGSGGNLTIDNSACNNVTEEYIKICEIEFKNYNNVGIALVVPEVPLNSRKELLHLATKYNFFRIASFSSEEIVEAKNMGLLSKVDFLSLNFDEALRLAKNYSFNMDDEEDVRRLFNQLITYNPNMIINITGGRKGNWYSHNKAIYHQKPHDVKVVNTAGAGDAYLAGVIIGIAIGLPEVLSHELGGLIAAFSVKSQDTIALNFSRESLYQFVKKESLIVSKDVLSIISEMTIFNDEQIV